MKASVLLAVLGGEPNIGAAALQMNQLKKMYGKLKAAVTGIGQPGLDPKLNRSTGNNKSRKPNAKVPKHYIEGDVRRSILDPWMTDFLLHDSEFHDCNPNLNLSVNKKGELSDGEFQDCAENTDQFLGKQKKGPEESGNVIEERKKLKNLLWQQAEAQNELQQELQQEVQKRLQEARQWMEERERKRKQVQRQEVKKGRRSKKYQQEIEVLAKKIKALSEEYKTYKKEHSDCWSDEVKKKQIEAIEDRIHEVNIQQLKKEQEDMQRKQDRHQQKRQSKEKRKKDAYALRMNMHDKREEMWKQIAERQPAEYTLYQNGSSIILELNKKLKEEARKKNTQWRWRI